MPRPDKTRPDKTRPDKTRPGKTARNSDADIYHRYAVGLYRQALSGHLARAGASSVPGIRPRDVISLVRGVLLSGIHRHGNHARPT
jgi:hypothetical protein